MPTQGKLLSWARKLILGTKQAEKRRRERSRGHTCSAPGLTSTGSGAAAGSDLAGPGAASSALAGGCPKMPI